MEGKELPSDKQRQTRNDRNRRKKEQEIVVKASKSSRKALCESTVT